MLREIILKPIYMLDIIRPKDTLRAGNYISSNTWSPQHTTKLHSIIIYCSHAGEGDRSVGGRDLLCTSLSSCHIRLFTPSFPGELGGPLSGFGGLLFLITPPNDRAERVGLGSLVEPLLDNFGRDMGLPGEADLDVKRLAIPERVAKGFAGLLGPASDTLSWSGLGDRMALRGKRVVLDTGGSTGTGPVRDCCAV